jgi:hypothetical protein
MKPALTPEEIAWAAAQPLVGEPSLSRLRSVLKSAGLNPIQLTLEDHGETVEFRLLRSAGLAELNDDLMTRLLIAVLRRSGFGIGFSEIALLELDDAVVAGFTYVASLSELFYIGPPQVEL